MCSLCEKVAVERPDLASWAKSFYHADGVIQFYVDKKGVLGDEPVTRKEFRHVKKQVRIIEAELDEITGNAFRTKFVRKPERADVEVFHMDDISQKGFGSAAGMWSVGSYARNGKGELVFDRDKDFSAGRQIYGEDMVKQILSHELGHMFGLGHTEFSDKGSIMNPSVGAGGPTFLTPSDLDIMRDTWM